MTAAQCKRQWCTASSHRAQVGVASQPLPQAIFLAVEGDGLPPLDTAAASVRACQIPPDMLEHAAMMSVFTCPSAELYRGGRCSLRFGLRCGLALPRFRLLELPYVTSPETDG